MKGHHHLLTALAGRQDAYAGARVLGCGDGPLRAELEARIAAAGLGRIVRFLGWRRDLPEILAASDCTVLPSVESENLSVAVLESLAIGIPAIVTQVGGMAEAVRDGFTGFVVRPVDSAALHEAMQRVLGDRELTVRLGRNARVDALSRFTRERMLREYVSILAERLKV
jgi:glycosyltransferase involved in cell wall biosynthesis